MEALDKKNHARWQNAKEFIKQHALDINYSEDMSLEEEFLNKSHTIRK